MVANQLYDLCEAVGPEATRMDLVPAYVRLLRDNKAEVRIAASGKDATIEQLLPIFLSLLKDEFPDVRLNIISKLDQVNQVIKIDLLSQSLLPAIVELAEDRHWRVRLAIIENVIAEYFVSLVNLATVLKSAGAPVLLMQALLFPTSTKRDRSIDDAAATNVKRLAEEFGPEWAIQHIIPQSLMQQRTGGFSRVPNIKFNVAKVLQSLIQLVDQSVVEKTIPPCLVELSEDQMLM
ncbi:hypothetical protein ACH5RR_008674 [Cinchona calisaya]|uniref:Uncharacterized protein n=1 Tax=Cinchona calisaya TaxID=153742 RepID=A0ABD3AFV0_9GENT